MVVPMHKIMLKKGEKKSTPREFERADICTPGLERTVIRYGKYGHQNEAKNTVMKELPYFRMLTRARTCI